MPDIELNFFGPPHIAIDGLPVPTQRRKSLALLAYLAVTQQSHARDTLTAILWPDTDQSHGRTVLRSVLADLHRALGPDALIVTGDQVALRRAPDMTVDVARFRELIAQVAAHHPAGAAFCDDCLNALSEAAGLYQADFLSGFTLSDALEFDEWQTYQTETLRLELAEVLEKLTHGLAQARRFADAAAHARRWLALDPLNELAHRCLIEIFAHTGDHSAAKRQYEECVRVLREELGIAPEEATTALYLAVISGGAAEPSPQLPLTRTGIPTAKLPPDLTPFIGRQTELAQLAERLADPACHLLTVFGPGGIGKTRLAIQAARSASARFAHGACFVDLAPLTSADFLSTAILQAVRAPNKVTEPDETLLDFLADKHLLLVLDNYEHLLSGPDEDRRDGYGLVTKLVVAAPDVKLLITSRSRLNVTAEWLAPLEGMQAPPEHPALDGAGANGSPVELIGRTRSEAIPGEIPESPSEPLVLLGHYSATALFLACARRLRPDFEPTSDEARTIGRICRLLGGMPLGIELAAAWTRTLSLAEIGSRLERGMDLLRSTARDVPTRHRSITAAFDYSWRMLSTRQRSVMRQLVVFRGDFDCDAAQAVAAASLADLAGLGDASWLRMKASGRLEMHPLVQQYCAAKLEAEHEQETGEPPDQVRDRHVAHYTSLIMPRWIQFARTGDALAETACDLHNTLAAWEWAIHCEDLPALWVLAGGLGWLSDRLGVHRLGADTLIGGAAALRAGTALVADDPARRSEASTIVALALIAGSERLARMNLLPRVSTHLAEAELLLGGDAGDDPRRRETRFYLLRMQGWLKYFQADIAEAMRLFYSSLVACQRGDMLLWPYDKNVAAMWEAEAYWSMALCALSAGNYQEARALAEQSITTCERNGLIAKVSYALRPLVHALIHLGDLPQAERHAVAALNAARSYGDDLMIGDWLLLVSRVYIAWDRWEEAKANLIHALAMARESGARAIHATALRLLGDTALSQGDAIAAQRFYEECLDQWRGASSGNSSSMSPAHVGLGRAALALGDATTAKMHLNLASIAPPVGAADQATLILATAELLAAEGAVERAVELLAFLARWTGTPWATSDAAQALLSGQKARLPDTDYAAAVARGQCRPVEEIFAQLVSAS